MNALCPFCNAVSHFKFCAKDLNNRVTKESFDYYRCSACGLVYLFSVPADIAKYYCFNYAPYDIPTSLKQLEAKAEDVRFRIDMVRQYAPKTGRLLEIGPSYGGFAFLAKQAGFSVDVVEIDSECCRFLKDVVRVNTICSDNVCKTLADLGQYDVITLWHVIEHLAEPWKVLDALAKHLSQDGIIIISAPNPDSFQFKLFGQFWAHLDAPRHLTLIPVKWLLCFLEERGNRKVLLTTTDPDGQKINKGGWRRSCVNLLLSRSTNDRYNIVQTNLSQDYQKSTIFGYLNWYQQFKTIIYKIGKFIFNLIFGLILCPLEGISMYGCAYTLIVKKDPINE
jgi:SAM-dependent methyltransferase